MKVIIKNYNKIPTDGTIVFYPNIKTRAMDFYTFGFPLELISEPDENMSWKEFKKWIISIFDDKYFHILIDRGRKLTRLEYKYMYSEKTPRKYPDFSIVKSYKNKYIWVMISGTHLCRFNNILDFNFNEPYNVYLTLKGILRV